MDVFHYSSALSGVLEVIPHICEPGNDRGARSYKLRKVDGSFVEANAAKESRIPREQLAEAAQVNQTVRQYLAELEQQNPTAEPVHQQDHVSTTDPDSTYATKGGTPAALIDNYMTKGNKSLEQRADGTETVVGLPQLDKACGYSADDPGMQVSKITTEWTRKFMRQRETEGAGPAMINRSLQCLRRGLNILREDG